MSDILKKPYEISVWEDIFVEPETENEKSYYYEKKIAVIGSDTMEGLHRVYNPVFTKNSNGEKTLTFSLHYKYFDPYNESENIINPFVALLVNERKVKLYYDGEWYEFIVKDHVESSEESVWTYTCTDAFVLELSKSGYNLEFSADLNNNQGTAAELVEAVIKETDWQLGDIEENKQLVDEPIYKATLKNVGSIHLVNADDGTPVTDISSNTAIYVFYNYVVNKSGQNVQFILQSNSYDIDDRNCIIATNYRIIDELTYDERIINNILYKGFWLNDDLVIDIELTNDEDKKLVIETQYQAYRLAYNQLTTYDKVLERTVQRYSYPISGEEPGEIYKYTDYEYSTSNILENYITNGENFNTYQDGTLQGWDDCTVYRINPPEISLVSNPELDPNTPLIPLDQLPQTEGFLKVDLGASGNTIFNTGITNHVKTIERIAGNEEFIFRWRAGKGNKVSALTTDTSVRCVVAFYTKINQSGESYTRNRIDPSNIILDFRNVGTPKIQNNIINSGNMIRVEASGELSYIIDNVIQEPSTKYVYIDKDNPSIEYVWAWNGTKFAFVQKTSNNFLDYYYLKAKTTKSINRDVLTDPGIQIGIFLCLADDQVVTYLQDVQLTRCVIDANGEPLTLGNIPTAISVEKSYYYVKPDDDMIADDVDTYTSLEAIANVLNINKNDIKPKYNENSVKVLSINESQSNCFNILQTIAETFEYWIALEVKHNEDGSIQLNSETNRPKKYIHLKRYAGKDNFAGFKYAINLSSIERTVNSDEIVTKLIVSQVQSDYTDTGNVSIQYADANKSGESYILNFDYYCNQGLIDGEKLQKDKIATEEEIKAKNVELAAAQKNCIDLEAALTALSSKRNVFTEMVNTAIDTVNKSLKEFQKVTGISYQEYQERSVQVETDDVRYHKYIRTEDETVIIGKNYYQHTNVTSSEAAEFVKITNPTGNPQSNGWFEVFQRFADNDTVVDIISAIYTNSAVKNNYGGLVSNLNTEYKNKRFELNGYENYHVTASMVADDNNQYHLQVVVSDYYAPLIFEYSGEKYEVTPNIKYFDINTNISKPSEGQAPVVLSVGFTVTDTQYYKIKGSEENYPVNFTILEDNPAQFNVIAKIEDKGKKGEVERLLEEKKKIVNSFNNKYSRFIQEGTWNASDYIDSNLYYLDALQVSHTSAQPKITYSISVIEVSQLEGLEYYLFDVGDKTYIEDTEFFGWSNKNGILTPAREEVIVSEVEWHLDDPNSNVITVQNYKTQFEDLFQRISAAVQTVQYNEAAYAKITSILDENGTINEDVLVASMNRIAGREYALTSDGSIIVDQSNMLIRNLTNSAKRVIINNEGIRISNDGGLNWSTAIDGNGINTGLMTAGSINTNNILIGNELSYSFRWDKNGISAYKFNPLSLNQTDEKEYDLKTFVRYDQYGLYGIKNNEDFIAQSIEDVENNAHFAVTWNGFFIRNSYEDGGHVSITSDNDFQVFDAERERIKIGSLGVVNNQRQYGIKIWDNDGESVLETDNQGNLTITGYINATGGNFRDIVYVGKNSESSSRPWIEIDGRWEVNGIPQLPRLQSSNYSNQTGWRIDSQGDAWFNNITARGAIRTTVFEYAEIQAVGGIFLFRPSSLIKTAEIASNGTDLILKVEKPLLFAKINYTIVQNPTSGSNPHSEGWYERNNYGYVATEDTSVISEKKYYIRNPIVRDGSWCKISNYVSDGIAEDPSIQNILLTNGLTHVYKILSVNVANSTVTLQNAAEMVSGSNPVTTLLELEGGALIDMGREDGSTNYGIGVNSSDNTINLPRRAISLFETEIKPSAQDGIRVKYKYRGILGTLPPTEDLQDSVDSSIYDHMQNTQGIYTDNMYIGDEDKYLAFYTDITDNNKKKLKIRASELMFEGSDGTPIDAKDSMIEVVITSSAGTVFRNNTGTSTLTCKVYQGNHEIDSSNLTYQWYRDADRLIGATYSSLNIRAADFNTKAVYKCIVDFR